MDKKTLDYIKTLTKNDKKNLSQKALKTCEEVGEHGGAVAGFMQIQNIRILSISSALDIFI